MVNGNEPGQIAHQPTRDFSIENKTHEHSLMTKTTTKVILLRLAYTDRICIRSPPTGYKYTKTMYVVVFNFFLVTNVGFSIKVNTIIFMWIVSSI